MGAYFLKVAKCGLFLFLSIWLDKELVPSLDGLILLDQIDERSYKIDVLMYHLTYIKEVIHESDHSI